MTPKMSDYIDLVLAADLTPAAKLVAILLRRIQGSADYSFPSTAEIGKRIGIARRGTLDALAQLRKAGLVEVHERRSLRLSSQYVCTRPHVQDDAPEHVHESAPAQVQNGAPAHVHGAAPVQVHEPASGQVQDDALSRCSAVHVQVQNGALHLLKQITEEDQKRESAHAPETFVVYPGNAARVAYERAVMRVGGVAMDGAGVVRELELAELAAERVIRLRAPKLAARDVIAKRDELLDEWADDWVADRQASARANGGTVRLKALWFAEGCLEAAAAGGRMPTPKLSKSPAPAREDAFPVAVTDEELAKFA